MLKAPPKLNSEFEGYVYEYLIYIYMCIIIIIYMHGRIQIIYNIYHVSENNLHACWMA